MTTKDGPGPELLGPRVRTAALVVGTIVAAVGLVTARAIYEGESRLEAADAAIRRQEPASAITQAAAAARWYVPGAPHVPAAYARLVHVARTAEVDRDPAMALLAWRAVRAAALDTAWLVQPHQDELALANAAIARLSADQPRPMMAREETPEQVERRLRTVLSREGAARAPWIATLAVGLTGLVTAAFWLARSALSAKGTLDRARARAPLALGLIGLALYALAVWRA